MRICYGCVQVDEIVFGWVDTVKLETEKVENEMNKINDNTSSYNYGHDVSKLELYYQSNFKCTLEWAQG